MLYNLRYKHASSICNILFESYKQFISNGCGYKPFLFTVLLILQIQDHTIKINTTQRINL